MVHSAGGLGHGLGSLYTAERNRTPLVVLAGQQTRALLTGEPYLMARRATEFPQPYVKFAVEPARPEDVPLAIAQAFRMARQAPAGPVFVSIPEDDWDRPAPPVPLQADPSHAVVPEESLRRLAGVLTGARHPALVLGSGVSEAARAHAVALAEALDADVLVAPLTARAVFPEDHCLFAGFLQPAADRLHKALSPHDVVAVIGAPVFTLHVDAGSTLVPEATRLVHITDSPGDAAGAITGESLLGDPGDALKRLTDLCALAIGEPRPKRPKRPQPRTPPALPMAENGAPLSPEAALAVVAARLPDDAVVLEEAPTHRNAMHAHLPIRAGQRFHVAASGSLGWAMPAAVGMALAEPERTVVCLVGDGSSLYSIQSLWTAAQRGTRTVFVVLNNGGYSAMKAFGRRLGVPEAPGLDLPGIDLTALAAGFGVTARRVTTGDDLDTELARAFNADRPVLLDVTVGPAAGELY
ncbi:benzoylformate decarboxylase [Pseudarthrobacter psychrotolerans]|uniref:Benzoylformate decarboxylase n=1 Tax=Pseudarthrobacter psychrotolerans TaxID=2697569 RepID=A0A6P1NJC1_9MICC|nr:benzoylformate decarboxylase [Pseudarthrobacter psychrotolerans]QHK18560.1 benzoylformate decarboxylase [Pseudarthrobacter psychrotolerans]